MQLYDPQRHQTLPVIDWEPERVKAWLTQWAQSALEIWDTQQSWPIHPRDASEFAGMTKLYTLYSGAFGVWLALARLAEAGYCRLDSLLVDKFAEVYEGYCQAPDTGERVPSWMLGESSLLTALELRSPDSERAAKLAQLLRLNRANPTREALWGAPGTMLAALMLYERTGASLWEELFLDSVEAVWASWFLDDASGVWLWEQDMYQQHTRYIGAGHGWAGNLYPLWRGRGLLSVEQREMLHERTEQGLAKLAVVDGELANWPALAEHPERRLVQWCHGAPGIITSLRHANVSSFLPLLRKGGRLIIEAGPLTKGVGLCHGTDGNGAALLSLHARTGEDVWLEAARRFAMWSMAQSEQAFAAVGQWRYALWTGDAGLACFLLDCLDGRSTGMPGIDAFW